MNPLPSDGWKSRKVIIGITVFAVMAIGGFACMLLEAPGEASTPIATFDQWAGLMKFTVPGVLVPLFGALGMDKIAEAKRE
jgi:hypothetical protein